MGGYHGSGKPVFLVTRWIGDHEMNIDSHAEILEQPFPEDPGPDPNPDPITYVDYFDAVRSFLETDGYAGLEHTITPMTGNQGLHRHIDAIEIHLLKHGRFYHPGKIDVRMDDTSLSFLINVAVSTSGIALARREFPVLRRLHSHVYPPVTPAVFHYAEHRGGRGRRYGMFTAEWLEGFHEWHTSLRPETGLPGIVVWDETENNSWLTPPQTHALYRRIAEILTDFYRLDTGEQVYPWHHAAGDFIVRIRPGNLDIRLVTVRQYAPMWETPGSDMESQMFSLLLFLCNLSIRTRLDRLNGTGEFVWSGPSVVSHTVTGFFNALAKKTPLQTSGEPVSVCFRNFCRPLSRSDVRDLCGILIDSYNPKAPEISLISNHIDHHSDRLWQCLGNANAEPAQSD